MAEDKKIGIHIATTADTSGAEAAEAAVAKVGEAAATARPAPRIIDANVRETENIQEQTEALTAWQKARDAARNSGGALAVDPDEYFAEIAAVAGAEAAAAEQKTEADAKAKERADAARADASEDREKAAQETRETIARAATMAELSKNVRLFGGNIARGFRDAAVEVRQYDAAAAEALENTADNIAEATQALGALVSGFATGGPLGAGMAALALGGGKLVEVFKDMEVAAIKAAAAERQAMESAAQATLDAAGAARERASEMTSDAIETSLRAQTDALSKQLEIIEKQVAAERRKRQEREEVFKSADKLKLAQIDEAEAGGKLTPTEAAGQRADVEQGATERNRDERKKKAAEDSLKADAAASKADGDAAATNEEAAAKEAQASQAIKDAEDAFKIAEDTARREREANAEKEVTRIRDNNILGLKVPYIGQVSELKGAVSERNAAREDSANITTPEQPGLTADAAKAAAEKAAADAAEFQKAALDARDAAQEKQSAATKARGDAGAATDAAADTFRTVDQVAANEDSATTARSNAERLRREQSQAKRDEKERQREKQNIDREALGAGRDAVKALPDGIKDAFREKVERAAGALEDGVQGDDLSQLIAPLERLADAAANKADKSAVKQILTRLANLEERVRKN